MHLADILFTIKSYLGYRWRAYGAHSIQSPFVYDLYTKAIQPSRSWRDPQIEMLRSRLAQNQKTIEVIDYKNLTSQTKTIASEAKSSLSSGRFSAFLNQLCNYLKIKSVLETGTSFGINTLYMAKSNPLEHLTTIEANPHIAHQASLLFEEAGIQTISLVNDDIYTAIPSVLKSTSFHMVFIDADHRASALRFYLQELTPYLDGIQVIIVHDIYWSKEMNTYWKHLTSDQLFPLSIDLFQAGLLFPNINMEKQHFTLKF